MKKNTGGPAFPVNGCGSDGMTLRDYFAAKAMQGEIMATAGEPAPDPTIVSDYAYKIADAMIKEREK